MELLVIFALFAWLAGVVSRNPLSYPDDAYKLFAYFALQKVSNLYK